MRLRRLPSLFFLLLRPPPRPPLFPYTTLFRSRGHDAHRQLARRHDGARQRVRRGQEDPGGGVLLAAADTRSEEHTSELQSHSELVCRLLLEKKNIRLLTERIPRRDLDCTQIMT